MSYWDDPANWVGVIRTDLSGQQVIASIVQPPGHNATVVWSPYTAPSSGPVNVPASTGVSPLETSYALYGHMIPLSVGGVMRIGGDIISGPWIENGLASFIISFGVPADPAGTRTLREIAFDSQVVWTSGGGFTAEAFTYRFYGGTLTQAADTLESTHFGANAVAYRPQILLAFSNLPLAGTKFKKIPYVAAVIADSTGDDVNLGEAFTRLAYSPWVGYTSAQFETSGITDGLVSGGLIIAQDAEFLSLIQQFGRFYPTWDILQTDKLRIVDRSATVTADIVLDGSRLTGPITVTRQGADTIKKELGLSTIDPGADYTIIESVAQIAHDPVAVTTSVGRDTAYLPAVMDASIRIATVTLARYHEEVTRKTIAGTAMIYGLQMEPGTLVGIGALGDDFTNEVFKVMETLHGANCVVEFTATPILRCTTSDPVPDGGGGGGGTGASTWNPSDKSGGISLSNGNLTATDSTAGILAVRGTVSKAAGSGKYYMEFTVGSTYAGGDTGPGICTLTASLSTVGSTAANAVIVYPAGNVWFNGSVSSKAIGALAAGSVVGVAVDLVSNKIWFRKDGGNWFVDASANPVTGVNGLSISAVFASAAAYPVFACNSSGSFLTANFGATAYAFTAPAGFGTW